jgi:hypothetical protein
LSHQIKDLIIWVNENKLNAGVIGIKLQYNIDDFIN